MAKFQLLRSLTTTLTLLSVVASPIKAQFTDIDFDQNPITTPLPAPPPVQPAQSCSEDSVTFELITGYVYSSPTDMLDSQPGTLMLTDCIQTCRQNQSCQSVNYETGLCVLFGSSAETFPSKKNP